jgi:hypothetical protein
LSEEERRWLVEVLVAERAAIAAKHSSRLRDAFHQLARPCLRCRQLLPS